MKKTIFLISFLSICIISHAQKGGTGMSTSGILVPNNILSMSTGDRKPDGQIISLTPYSYPDSIINRIARSIPNAKAIITSVDFFKIEYWSDGLKVTGYLSQPKKSGTYPCIIFNRGGNRDFGALGEMSVIRFLGETASWGYVVVGSQYRGNEGGEGKEEFGGRDVNDILNLIPFLSQVDKADTSRIGMYGWSRGGMMTYLTLTKTNRIKAAIVGSGMADAFVLTSKRPEMDSVFAQLAPGYYVNRDSVLMARSAAHWANQICKTTPLLLLTGSADWRVSPEEQLSMVSKLYESKHPFRFNFFEGGEHSLIEHLEEVNQVTRSFLDAYVRDRKALPNLEPHGN